MGCRANRRTRPDSRAAPTPRAARGTPAGPTSEFPTPRPRPAPRERASSPTAHHASPPPGALDCVGIVGTDGAAEQLSRRLLYSAAHGIASGDYDLARRRAA